MYKIKHLKNNKHYYFIINNTVVIFFSFLHNSIKILMKSKIYNYKNRIKKFNT